MKKKTRFRTTILPVGIVTGAAQGIGFAIASRLAHEGFHVVMADKNGDRCKSSAEKLRAESASVEAFRLDIASEKESAALADHVALRYGAPAVLVNNAAISPKGRNNRKTETLGTDLTEWKEVFETNLFGTFLCCKWFAKLMRDASVPGSIINIASMMGLTGAGNDKESSRFPFSSSGSHYCASKAGVLSLTKSLARELAPWNIRVNSVSPGAVGGGMGKFSPEFSRKLQSQICLTRLAKPEEIAETVAFLASPKAAYITGENINVNGGWFMA
jgi:3-oxoacyl-[acyl-carrier protein] reductase